MTERDYFVCKERDIKVAGFHNIKNICNFFCSNCISEERERAKGMFRSFCTREVGEDEIRRGVMLYQFLSDPFVNEVKKGSKKLSRVVLFSVCIVETCWSVLYSTKSK